MVQKVCNRGYKQDIYGREVWIKGVSFPPRELVLVLRFDSTYLGS